MFNYPGTSLYDAQGNERVVWSVEEYEAALAEGWTEDAPTDAAAEPAAKPKRGRR